MEHIAVVGGTGLAGRMLVAQAAAAGHQVRSISRHLPALELRRPGVDYVRADAANGDGLAAALKGCTALIETMDARSPTAMGSLPVTSAGVLATAARAGVMRCVLLTIANAHESSFRYYQIQAARALSYERSGMPTSVVYATQFHDLVAGIFAQGAKVGIIPVFRDVAFQSISTADVASVLLQESLHGFDAARRVSAGGPEVLSMREMALEWKQATKSKAVLTPMRLPGSFGKFLRAGRNLVPEAAVGQGTFSAWLAAR